MLAPVPLRFGRGLGAWRAQSVIQGRSTIPLFHVAASRRATVSVTAGPTMLAVREAAWGLARYAAICQDNGLVPIVEPEILLDGEHDIHVTQQVWERVWAHTFFQMAQCGVLYEGILLKPSMACVRPPRLTAVAVRHHRSACASGSPALPAGRLQRCRGEPRHRMYLLLWTGWHRSPRALTTRRRRPRSAWRSTPCAACATACRRTCRALCSCRVRRFVHAASRCSRDGPPVAVLIPVAAWDLCAPLERRLPHVV